MRSILFLGTFVLSLVFSGAVQADPPGEDFRRPAPAPRRAPPPQYNYAEEEDDEVFEERRVVERRVYREEYDRRDYDGDDNTFYCQPESPRCGCQPGCGIDAPVVLPMPAPQLRIMVLPQRMMGTCKVFHGPNGSLNLVLLEYRRLLANAWGPNFQALLNAYVADGTCRRVLPLY